MVRGGLVRWGVFLLALGGVLLLGQSGGLDPGLAREALGLWPVAVILAGAAILVRRTRLALPVGVLAAAMPGLLLGGLFVALPDVGSHCRGASPAGFTTRQGTFDTDANVELRVSCGDLTVTTMAGSDWEARLGQSRNPLPVVTASSDNLRVETVRRRIWLGSPDEGDLVDVRLPTDRKLNLAASVNAGVARLDLERARLDVATVSINAGKGRVDLTGATVTRLVVAVHAGEAALLLPAADFRGELEVAGGELNVCVPPDLGVRLFEDVTMGSVDHPGMRAGRGSSTWESDNFAVAPYTAELSVSVNVGSVHIDPAGGCQ